MAIITIEHHLHVERGRLILQWSGCKVQEAVGMGGGGVAAHVNVGGVVDITALIEECVARAVESVMKTGGKT